MAVFTLIMLLGTILIGGATPLLAHEGEGNGGSSFMEFIQSNGVPWAVFILGIISAVSGLLIFLGCRIVPTTRLTQGVAQSSGYKVLFRYHKYLWLVFWISLVIHLVLGILHFGFPSAV